jgi:hypothetical protein
MASNIFWGLGIKNKEKNGLESTIYNLPCEFSTIFLDNHGD